MSVKKWDGLWPDLSVPRECRLDPRMGGMRKKAFTTEAEALANSGPGLNVYQCGTCGQWHVGHKRGGGRLRRSRK